MADFFLLCATRLITFTTVTIMPKIYLYAEVLTHIRQLTLHASLQSDRDESPEIDISSDKKVITVKHDGESSSLYLPTQILGTANVTFETHKRAELNARIQIEDLQEWKDIETAGIEAPWVASELTSCTAIRCRSCEEVLLSSQSISAWKDLPSQDWADVMDLWYCHKPHEGDDTTEQKDAAKAKGTSATSRLISQQGTGMVDLTSFVLNPDDCANIKVGKYHVRVIIVFWREERGQPCSSRASIGQNSDTTAKYRSPA